MFHIYITVRRILWWVEFRVNRLFQVTRLSAIQIIIVTLHRSNEYMQNLEFHQARKKVIITVSQLFSFVSYFGPEADDSTTCPGRNNSAMRVEKLSKEFFCFHRHYFHRYSVTFFSIIFLCLCHSSKFFTTNFIYSDLSFDCLNRLTVYTVSINRFTSL